MKRKFYRVVTILIAVLMLASVMAGCGSTAGQQSSAAGQSASVASTDSSTGTQAPDIQKEFVTLKVLYPGDESKRMTDFLANEFAEKIKAELNLGLDMSYSPWSDYFNKVPMMLAAGEELDWIWNGTQFAVPLIEKKLVMPLDNLLDQYGQDLKTLIPPESLEQGKFGGKLMYLSNTYTPTANLFQTVLVRQDILEQVGINEIKTIDDLTKVAEAVKSNDQLKSMNIFAGALQEALTREFFANPISIVTFPDFVGVDLVTNKAFSFYESEEYQKYVKQMAQWKNDGYINDDVTIKLNEENSRMASGNYVFGQGAISRPMENIGELRKNVPAGMYKEYVINPDKPSYKSRGQLNVLMIGATAKYPERAMQFINWIYKSKDNYNFTIYGVKDKDYTLSNGHIKLINKDDLFYEWMFRNINIMDFPDSVDDEFVNTFKHWEDDAKVADIYGFNFDNSSLTSEYSKISTIVTEKFLPLTTGFVDFDKYYPAAVKALKDAGIDKYVTEYQTQIDAFIAARKK